MPDLRQVRGSHPGSQAYRLRGPRSGNISSILQGIRGDKEQPSEKFQRLRDEIVTVFDEIILSTGSVPVIPRFIDMSQKNICTAQEVLSFERIMNGKK